MISHNAGRRMGAKIFNSILPVLLAFLVGAVIILIIGDNPLVTYWQMIRRSLFSANGITRTLHIAAPMLLAGLAISITFKANIFNMGVEGQLVFGGFAAGLAGFYINDMDPVLLKLVCFGIGALCGMLFAFLPALLRAYFHVDEMVVTLTLNYAMLKVLEFLSTGPFRDHGSGYVCTPLVQSGAMFNRMGSTRFTPFVFAALALFGIMAFILKKTKLGYALNAIGRNPSFAEATGLRTRRTIIIIMLISGALAGIAGTGHMLAEKFRYTLDFSGSPGIGWDGMLIALLGRHSPVGILIAGIFYSMLTTGADNISMYTDVPNEIVAVIQSLIILFLAVRFFDERYGIFSKLGGRLSRNKTDHGEVSRDA